MTGYLLLTAAILFQIAYAICRFRGIENHRNYKRLAYAAAFAAVNVLLITKALPWNFTCYLLYFYLALRTIIGLLKMRFGKKTPNKAGKVKIIFSAAGSVVFTIFVLLPIFLFPSYDDLAVTGSYQVETASYTYVDPSRTESFEDDQTNRKVTVQFWYPVGDEAAETYPLIIFSHGAFGYRMSNYSTFMDLASNGYVVCSIDHPYHAFFTDHTDGTSVIANLDFLNEVMQISNFEEEKIHELSTEWLKLRTGDMQFILDTIIKNAENADAADPLFSSINTDRIGLSGHSLGGAAAAQVGRDREDIAGVICIDGTMLGEAVDFADGEYVLNDTAYPVPLLNLYAEKHYLQAKEQPDVYQNSVASRNALESYDIMIEGAGHLNFTDLPMVSPVLAGLLGTGSVDARYCMETMNEIVLEFFDHTLKGESAPQFREKY